MKRQRLRKTIILISFLLFPVTIYYFSPALPIMGGAEGIVSGSILMFGLMFVSSLIFGRAFCGWICPAGGMQEVCFMVQKKRIRNPKMDWIKYFIWLPWIVIIILAFIQSGGVKKLDPLYQTTFGISVAEPYAYIVYYFFTALIVILSLTLGRRAFCHSICWMAPFMVIGHWIQKHIGWPALHLRSDREKCIQCKTCTHACPMSLNVEGLVSRGEMSHSECILCGSCVDVCPEDVISYHYLRDK